MMEITHQQAEIKGTQTLWWHTNITPRWFNSPRELQYTEHYLLKKFNKIPTDSLSGSLYYAPDVANITLGLRVVSDDIPRLLDTSPNFCVGSGPVTMPSTPLWPIRYLSVVLSPLCLSICNCILPATIITLCPISIYLIQIPFPILLDTMIFQKYLSDILNSTWVTIIGIWVCITISP